MAEKSGCRGISRTDTQAKCLFSVGPTPDGLPLGEGCRKEPYRNSLLAHIGL